MSKRTLPVINYSAFRKFPTRSDTQNYTNDKDVCKDCLSGACCSSEDPIYLSSFDVFRLSAFFDMSPAQFLVNFTQDRFGNAGSDEVMRPPIDDPDCSTMTYLRRRDNNHASPCIFLRYVREGDATPRRICGVYDARPLACREFYFDTCKNRVTGELAALLAEGFEMVRDGVITEEIVDAMLASFQTDGDSADTIARTFEQCFWVEMKRVINMDQANVEGADSYDAAEYQDAIDEKLNRLLSARYLRFEEWYGPEPSGEQVADYSAGVGFAGSSEYGRILSVVRSQPSSGLFKLANYGYDVGFRTMVTGVRHAETFATIPDSDADRFLNGIPARPLFPDHSLADVRAITLRDIYSSILRAINHLIRFCSRIVALEEEVGDDPGQIELDLLSMTVGFETSLNPYIASNPYLAAVKHHFARAALASIEERIDRPHSAEELFSALPCLASLRTAASPLPDDLRGRVEGIFKRLVERLDREQLDMHVGVGSGAGKRAGDVSGANRRGFWRVWRKQILYTQYATVAGFDGLDFTEFYRQSVDTLQKLNVSRRNRAKLSEIVSGLARSLILSNSLSTSGASYQDEVERLAEFSLRFIDGLRIEDHRLEEWEKILRLFDAGYKGLGLSYNRHPAFGETIRVILNSQLADGGWGTDGRPGMMPASQDEYLSLAHRLTWACVDVLRPTRSDSSSLDGAEPVLT